MSGAGLLKVAAGAGARRRYGLLGLSRARFIHRAAAGFSLADIGGLIRRDSIKDREAEMPGMRLAAVEEKLAELVQQRFSRAGTRSFKPRPANTLKARVVSDDLVNAWRTCSRRQTQAGREWWAPARRAEHSDVFR